MKRPILIAVIGYIIGIIMGLYFNFSIVFLYIPITAILSIIYICKIYNKKYKNIKSNKLKLLSINRYFRYIKIIINSKTISIFIIGSIISNSILIHENKKYENLYKELQKTENNTIIGIITNEKEKKDYYDQYIIKTEFKNKTIKLYINIKNSNGISLSYGDKVILNGTYIEPEEQRNYKGFDYSKYLKQLKICGTLKVDNIKIIEKNKENVFLRISNNISKKIKKDVKRILPKKEASIFLGLILGDTTTIDEELKENFQNANMSHILAVSGMHIAYIILGINIILKKIIGKKKVNILSIFVLIIYMFITNFSPSITRAGIMGIILLISKIIYRKNDIITTTSISLLVILIYNPFLISNLGIQLSFGGVVGIIVFNKIILTILKNIKSKNKIIKYKIKPRFKKHIDKIKEIIAISVSVQIVIMPIILYQLNTLNPYFLLTNLILSIVIGPIVIICFIFTILILMNFQITKFVSNLISILIEVLINISNIGKIPYSKIYIPTPSIIGIIIYYMIIIILKEIYKIYFFKTPNQTQKRTRNLIALAKYKINQNKLKCIRYTAIVIILIIVIKTFPQNLKINFIDVGQGDACFIVTPQNKTILIDGGGSEFSNFDVGKNTLLPYILDKGYNKIDIVIISHFDSDHVSGILTIMKELEIGTIYISRQGENCDNYKEFIEIIKEKNIKTKIVKEGETINIEKDLYFDVLWPKEKLILDNILNNNSIVCKLNYKNFSMLFTGDIEEIAEKEIIKTLNQRKLKSTVLKVGHHGSKTSTIEEFLKEVNPQICLIGVGKNNKFGHPNNEVINRITSTTSKIYRTDLNGEININVNKKGKIKTTTKYN